MPPLRRSARLKRTNAASILVAEEERFSTRQKKRREICTPHRIRSPSAEKMDAPSMVLGIWSDDSKLQREAAHVLKNITRGTSENTKTVIDCGAVPVFVKLLESSEFETLEQAVWALGNIAGHSPRCRDIVRHCGALHPLLTLLNEHSELSFLRIGAWTLSNCLEGKPEVLFEQLESAIPVLASLILTDDQVVLKEACWALSYLSGCGGGIESAMLEADLCSKLAKLFKHAPPSVLLPAIRTFTSIANGIKTLDERALEAKGHILYIYDRNDVSNSIVEEAHHLKLLLDTHMVYFMDAMRMKTLATK